MSESVEIREKSFDALSESAEKAFSQSGRIVRAFRLQEHEFLLRFAGDRLAQLMTRALNHLSIPEITQRDYFTLDCWDLTQSGLPFPPGIPRKGIPKLDEMGTRIEFLEWMQLLNGYFPIQKKGFYCIKDAEKFQIQHLGSPAHYIFDWWLGSLGWQFTHAAAVGTEKGGVLIAGYGGAGKSTLTFSTLDSPLRYLSDDYCVLVPGHPPRVLALYNSGKLCEESFRVLPHLRSRTCNSDDPQREKALFFLHEQFPGQQVMELPLKAIVLPQIRSNRTYLEPVDKKEILRTLIDSTGRQLSGFYVQEFMRILRSIRDLPAYRLHLEEDFAPAHKIILELCH